MKRIIITLLFSCMLCYSYGQSIGKKEARQFLENAWNYLKTADTTSFIDLWHLSPAALEHEGRPMSRKFIMGDFDFIKEYLDTALKQGLSIYDIDISKENLEGTDTKYWVQAWFKYSKHYYKGFGFYIANDAGKWVVRNCASTSTLRRS